MKRWLAVAALVVGGSIPLQQDLPPWLEVRPAFTVFAVGATGASRPIAHFDGLRWEPACAAGSGGAPGSGGVPGSGGGSGGAPVGEAVVGIRGSIRAPLLAVTEMTSASPGWSVAWRTVEQRLRARAAADVTRVVTEVHVYAVENDRRASLFVDLVLRAPIDGVSWAGIAASAWVRFEGRSGALVTGLTATDFSTYDEYLAIPRLSPLGLADTGHPWRLTWVMREQRPHGEAVRLFDVAGGSVAVGPVVPGGGC